MSTPRLLALALTAGHYAAALELRALVIGGTGFMGRHTVPVLLDAGFHVEMVGTGRSPNPWAPRVPETVCERHKICMAEKLKQGPWDLVVDFPVFSTTDIKTIAENRQWIRHYVFPSSDDVYMVCDPTAFTYGSTGGLLEESSVRPSDAGRQSELNSWDSYGSNKMLLEDTLKRSNVNFTAMRLPDVWGPFDGSGRFFTFLRSLIEGRSIGLKIAAGNPVFPRSISGETFRPGFVFAKDVAAMIKHLFLAGPQNRPLNVAVEDAPTVEELVTASRSLLERVLGPMIANVTFDRDKEVPLLSTDIGPLDISRAKALGFEPTPWRLGWAEAVAAFAAIAKNESLAEDQLERCIKACDRTCYCEPLQPDLGHATFSV